MFFCLALRRCHPRCSSVFLPLCLAHDDLLSICPCVWHMMLFCLSALLCGCCHCKLWAVNVVYSVKFILIINYVLSVLLAEPHLSAAVFVLLSLFVLLWFCLCKPVAQHRINQYSYLLYSCAGGKGGLSVDRGWAQLRGGILVGCFSVLKDNSALHHF